MKSLQCVLAGLLLAIACHAQQWVPFDANGPLGPGVKRAPFSADVVTESERTLSDGTHIRSGTHGRGFRDSAGRTREEFFNSPMLADGVETLSVVEIVDPAQHLRISLEPREKTATVMESDLGVRIAPANPTQPRFKQPGEEELGASSVEGVAVTGKRYTTAIPVGRVGNDKSFNAVDEAWFSPDLQIVVLQTSESPYDGKSVWKLTNIQTGEQDPALFEIPPDYKVVRR